MKEEKIRFSDLIRSEDIANKDAQADRKAEADVAREYEEFKRKQALVRKAGEGVSDKSESISPYLFSPIVSALPDSKELEKKPEAAIELPERRVRPEAEQTYQDLLGYLHKQRERVAHSLSPEIDKCLEITRSILKNTDLIGQLHIISTRNYPASDYIIPHLVNTAIFSLRIGQGLGYSNARLFELALGALHYDIGMLKVPAGIINKQGPLTEAEANIIKTHPEAGKSILEPSCANFSWIPAMAWGHHERENGRGYPRGLKGSEIDELTKIVSLMDSYEAMTHDRPYRRARLPALSARELVNLKGSTYMPQIVKIFLRKISLYPIGSLVRLNNKSIGRVVETNDEHPLRPDVQIISNPQGIRVPNAQFLRLCEHPLFFIVESISGLDLPHPAES